jgi:two-component sensor histidine kinase
MAPKSLYQVELEAITRSGLLSQDNMELVLLDIGKRITGALKIARINIWLFNESRSELVCIANYDAQSDSFTKGEYLLESDIPAYYAHLVSDEILVIDDVHTNLITADLKDNYCEAHDIYSMMDVPIRIEGQLAGVMCYEQVGKYKEWSEEEQFFALAINQIVSLVIETHKRRESQRKLQKALEDKERLMAEMHHRIKNNLSTLISLLRIQSREVEDDKFSILSKDIENRLFSISKIHEQLYSSRNYLEVSMKRYLEQLVSEFRTAHPEIEFQLELQECAVSTDNIVPLGLICNEVIINAIKYAFEGVDREPLVEVVFRCEGNENLLEIADNGKGFNFDEVTIGKSFGLSLISDLSGQLGSTPVFQSNSNGTRFILRFGDSSFHPSFEMES